MDVLQWTCAWMVNPKAPQFLFWRMNIWHFPHSPFCVPQCSSESGVKISFQNCVAVVCCELSVFSPFLSSCSPCYCFTPIFQAFLKGAFELLDTSFLCVFFFPQLHVCFPLNLLFLLHRCTFDIYEIFQQSTLTLLSLVSPNLFFFLFF